MKVCIVSCFDMYYTRNKFVESFFVENGFEVISYIADFNHVKKEYQYKKRKNLEFIHVKAYKKNISFKRVYSNYSFGRKVYKELELEKPDIIFATIPPNSVVKYVTQYKRRNAHVKVIFDICDLWPESLVGRFKGMMFRPVIYMWKQLRDRYIGAADWVLCECTAFYQVVANTVSSDKCTVVYLMKEKTNKINSLVDSMECIHLCYVGTINYLIDIDKICLLIAELCKYKKLCVHIIGDGEKRQELIERLRNIGALVNYYGLVFEEERKQKIYSKCHFGINIMRKDVSVGLTLKSLDYFTASLPILNSIGSDTYYLVDQYHVGFNLHNIQKSVEEICKLELSEYRKLRENVDRMYEGNFTGDKLYSILETLIKELK